jgi:hypothetical protein
MIEVTVLPQDKTHARPGNTRECLLVCALKRHFGATDVQVFLTLGWVGERQYRLDDRALSLRRAYDEGHPCELPTTIGLISG